MTPPAEEGNAPAHPVLKWAGPSILGGGVLILAGVLIVRGIIPLEPGMAIGIVIAMIGLFFLIFGFTVRAAGRMLAALPAADENEEADR